MEKNYINLEDALRTGTYSEEELIALVKEASSKIKKEAKKKNVERELRLRKIRDGRAGMFEAIKTYFEALGLDTTNPSFIQHQKEISDSLAALEEVIFTNSELEKEQEKAAQNDTKMPEDLSFVEFLDKLNIF